MKTILFGLAILVLSPTVLARTGSLTCDLWSAKHADTPRYAKFVAGANGDFFNGQRVRSNKKNRRVDGNGNTYIISYLSQGRSAIYIYGNGQEPMASQAIATYACDGSLN